MKIKKIIVILICSILTIFLSVLVGLYTFGSLGGWDKYQRQFVSEYYNDQKTSKDLVNTYINFNSTTYRNHTVDVKLFEDYESSNTLIDCGNEIKLDNMTVSLYVLMGETGFNKFDYDMYFYNIDNSNVNMHNITVILFESLDESDTLHLKQGLIDFKDNFLDPENELDAIYSTDTLYYLSQNNFFDTGDLIFDLDGKAKIVNGTNQNRLLFHHSLSYTYGENIKNIKSLSFCNFAIIELLFDEDENPQDLNILCCGQIQNLSSDQEEYTNNHTDIQKGFGLSIIPALKQAGYTKYAMPKVIRNSCIAFFVVGFLCVMFYITLNNYWKSKDTPTKKTTKKKKE